MRIEKQIKTVITIEMDLPNAEILCADILYLLECTKDLAGMVPGGAVFAADDCRQRLTEFLSALQDQC